MSKKAKALILIIVFTMVSAADCLLTWKITPDLSFEANFLVSRLGLGWPALIGANIFIVIIYAIFVYYSFVTYKEPQIYAANAKEYRVEKDKASGWRSTIAMVGYAMSFSMILARLLPVIEWLSYLYGKPSQLHYFLRSIAPVGRIDLVMSAVLAAVFAAIWLIRHYRFPQEKAKGENS